MARFTDLSLIPALQRALTHEGYEAPTEIQARAIPPLLEGKDLLGCAQTGTGKTAAFLLPLLQHLDGRARPQGPRRLRALVLTPTRELAAQIGDSAAAYGRYLSLRHTVIFGGTGERAQIQALRGGVDLLVATPGRLLDLLGRGYVDLSAVELFVLDEADRMLDMGFIHDVRRVLAKLPQRRQNLLFSATLPPEITKLASSFLHAPVSVSVTPTATTVEQIEQRVVFVPKAEKQRTLLGLLREDGLGSAIVFTRTKGGANRLAKQLCTAGVEAAAIHGNKSQGARTRTLEAFRNGGLRVLVATDLASRGLDVDVVTHVVNYDLPNEPASYVHRIGRTGRAGRAGVAIALCDPSTERGLLRDIERLIGRRLDSSEPVSGGAHEPAEVSAAPAPSIQDSRGGSRRGGSRRGGGSRSDAGSRRDGGARSGGGSRDGRGGGSRDGRGGGSRDGRDGGSRDGRGGGSRDGRDGGSRDGRDARGGRAPKAAPVAAAASRGAQLGGAPAVPSFARAAAEPRSARDAASRHSQRPAASRPQGRGRGAPRAR
ncbi:MAG: DEAD/DEAH box helicase [Planctomycetota bacterium]